jgi:predicted transcriptional regulator
MDVLEALGGWSNINREKLDQIKVDNPPLYNAITKALNLLAKKYGGEDIVIQKPIEVVPEVVPEVVSQNEDEITDYKILKKIEILSLSKGDWPTRMEILDALLNEVGYDKDELTAISKFIQDLYKKIDDLNARDLILRVDDEYQVSGNGQALIDSYELQNKQVGELTPSDEALKLEILLRMADYYDGGVYKLLNQDDIIKYAVKHTFNIPSNKYFGLVVKLLGDGFVEKDPSGDTDSIRLTNQGYDKAMNWFEENLPEEGIPTTPPSTQLTDLQISILEGVKEASETKVGDGFVTINEIWGYNRGVKPNYYSVFATAGQSTPSLEKDLELLYAQGYLEFLFAGIGVKDYTYRLSQKGIDFLNDLKSQATTQLSEEDRYMNILKTIIIYKTKFAQNPKYSEIYKKFRSTNVVPITYEINNTGNNNPNFDEDLDKLLNDDLVEQNYGQAKNGYEVTLKGKTMLQNYLKSKGTFNEFISEIEVLSAQSKTNQSTSTLTQLEEEPTQGLNYRRPSPLESATLFATGTTKIGNDGNEWRVTENKNGVKRWVKVGEPQYDLPQHRLEGVLKRLSEAISKTHDYVTISELYRQLYDVIVPITYTQYGLSGEPTLEKDLEVMERMGLVKSRKTTFGKEYYIDTKGGEMLTQLKFEEAQKQKPQILAQAQITKTPEFSQEPPISEIEEDEVDLDILEQQLNDDSLEFDISDEDLDNLEF